MAKATNANAPEPLPDESANESANADEHGPEVADAVELVPDRVPDRDPLDATEETFTDEDADDRGWIVHYELPGKGGVRRYHRVPVAKWAAYEKRYGL